MFVKSGARGMRLIPRATPHFKTSIANLFFCRAPGKFEAPETFVFFRGPAKMQSFRTCLRQTFYSFRHGQVIGTQFLPSFIRGTKFVDRMSPEPEEHGCGERALLVFDEHDKSMARIKQMS